MSVQRALEFIRATRDDPALLAQLRSLDSEASLEALLAMAEASGFAFTAEEFRSAFRHDFAFRQARFGANPPGSARD